MNLQRQEDSSSTCFWGLHILVGQKSQTREYHHCHANQLQDLVDVYLLSCLANRHLEFITSIA